MAQPHIPCALEFIDGRAIEMIREYSGAALPEHAAAMLMIEVDGPAGGIDAAAAAIEKAAGTDALIEFTLARSDDETAALWATRKALSPALRNVAPKKINEDIVVPVSKMPDLIEGLQRLGRHHDITIVNFGHAGNGNIHVNLLVNPDDRDEMTRAHACLDDVFSLVLQLDGTLSGEHGVGLEKRDYIDREIDPVTMGLMLRIREQFDPAGILNADKLFPPLSGQC